MSNVTIWQRLQREQCSYILQRAKCSPVGDQDGPPSNTMCLGSSQSPSQTGSHSVQLFLHSAAVTDWLTHTHHSRGFSAAAGCMMYLCIQSHLKLNKTVMNFSKHKTNGTLIVQTLGSGNLWEEEISMPEWKAFKRYLVHKLYRSENNNFMTNMGNKSTSSVKYSTACSSSSKHCQTKWLLVQFFSKNNQ